MSILGCQNGAQVEQFLRQSMEEHNMNLEPGLCTAINKGIFVCPEAGTPRNFTPFFIPPVGDDEEEEENSHLLKMAMQEKLDNTDIQLLTKMEVKIPTKAQDIKHHIKNFAGIAGRCFGEDSLLFQSLQKIVKHMERREPRYQYELRQNALFGGHLLDKINWRVHRFLDSCAGGEAEDLETDLLDFSEMVYQIDRRDWVTMAPTWLNKLVKKKEKRPVEEETEQGRTKKRRQFKGEEDKARKIPNPNMREDLKLKHDEQYGLIFHPGNIKNLEKPKKSSGNPICLRFHSIGFCYNDCKVHNGHGTLTEDEAKQFKEFIKQARAERDNFQRKRTLRTNTTPNTAKGEN